MARVPFIRCFQPFLPVIQPPICLQIAEMATEDSHLCLQWFCLVHVDCASRAGSAKAKCTRRILHFYQRVRMVIQWASFLHGSTPRYYNPRRL